MGGVVKKTLGKAESAGVIKKIPEATPEAPVQATRAETQAARERQASLRARRGRSNSGSLLSSQDTLG